MSRRDRFSGIRLAAGLIAPTYAGRNLHLYKRALFPRIYNVGLIKGGCKNGDILPARILAVVLADGKTRRHGNDDGGPMVEGNEHALSRNGKFQPGYTQSYTWFVARDSRYLLEFAPLHFGAPFRALASGSCITLSRLLRPPFLSAASRGRE